MYRIFFSVVSFVCTVALENEASVRLPACDCMCLFISSATREQAPQVLKIVLPELYSSSAPIVPCVSDGTDADAGSTHAMRVSINWSSNITDNFETYTSTVTTEGDIRVINITVGGKLGLAYALHAIHGHLRLAETRAHAPPCSDAWIAHAARFEAPAASPYRTRTWSEEGQLLDLPERAYYNADGSMNMDAVAAEAAALEAEMVPPILRLGFNSLTLLHSDIEDYVTYATLPAFLPGAPPVYPANDTHWKRVGPLSSFMNAWVRNITVNYGITVYFQVYEMSWPSQLCTFGSTEDGVVDTANISPSLPLNCSLGSTELQAILMARYNEFFANVPDVAGIVLTLTDSWQPRAGYNFTTLWKTTAELAQVATVYYNAIVLEGGRPMICRLHAMARFVRYNNIAAGCGLLVREWIGKRCLMAHHLAQSFQSSKHRETSFLTSRSTRSSTAPHQASAISWYMGVVTLAHTHLCYRYTCLPACRCWLTYFDSTMAGRARCATWGRSGRPGWRWHWPTG
jgi:hypothetical protein